MKTGKSLLMTCSLVFLLQMTDAFISNSLAQANYVYNNNWYVGDTEAGEWIKHKKVWIADGDYRFTTRVVAPEAGRKVSLALNDSNVFADIEVPADKTGRFHLLHLGSMYLEAGYYDVQLIFETGDTNCDMIFIKKDARTDNVVLDTDIEYTLNHADGMHISPIAGASGSTSILAKYGDPGDAIAYYYRADPGNGIVYNREQVMQWNKQPIYTYHHEYTQEAMDILVQELTEAKIDFMWAHGRGEPDTQNEIIDRAFKEGAGGMPCRGLKVLVEAINRNPYAKNNLKIAYFFDSAASFTSAGMTQFYTGSLDYRNNDFRTFMWKFAVQKWYQTIPKDMLFTLPDPEGLGRTIVPMQWWTCGIGTKWGNRGIELTGGEGIVGFFEFLKEKMETEFGITPAWILDNSFFDKGGNAVKNIAWGTQAWFIWGQSIMDIRTFNNRKFAFALNGGRIPMYEAVLNDWDPDTDEGTFVGDNNKQKETKGFHTSALNYANEPAIRSMYRRGTQENAEWMVLESWFDWQEGSTWYRSGHSEYAYPNQHIALCREYADKETTCILLEAESCDEFFDKSLGNTGGSYRLDWYKESEFKKDYIDANLEVDIDIFRPLHHLSAIIPHTGALPANPNKIVAGLKDVWILAGANNTIYANELDGVPVVRWNALTNNNMLKKLTLGGYSAWGITANGAVVRSSLPGGQRAHVNDSWRTVDGNIKMIDLDANNAMIWAIDEQSNIYYRNFAATKPWVKIEGKLTSIAVDESFGWGFDPEGKLQRFSLQNRSDWKEVDNPHNLKHLSVNCEEVWGINDDNEVYRMSSSGFGKWEKVATGFKDVSVGTNYVWFLDVDGLPHNCELTSFTDYSVFTSGNYHTSIIRPEISAVTITAYPNPYKDRLSLKITSNKEERLELFVCGIDGKVVFRDRLDVPSGISVVELGEKLQHIHSGIYLITINKNSGKEIMKIVKK